jgi:hypothetical protein
VNGREVLDDGSAYLVRPGEPSVPEAVRDRFRAAAPAATTTVHPTAGHRLDLAALTVRTRWLSKELGLP